MQTLNVGAGRTDEEHKATEEQRRADLRSDCRDDANYFFWAAGLSALGTGLLPVRLNLLVSVGTVDLLTLYGRPLGPFYPLAGCGKSLNRDDSPPQGLKPSLILHDLRGAKAPLYHSAAGFRDFFRSLLKDIAAEKEVILAAGAINTPKLLMLSGVGEAKALRSLGINVVENLPGVGENLRDHVLVSGVVFKYKGKMPDRPADSNAVEAEAYLSSSPSGDTDISLVLHQLPVVTPEVVSRFGTPPPNAFTIPAALVQPTSIGSVRLASDNFQ